MSVRSTARASVETLSSIDAIDGDLLRQLDSGPGGGYACISRLRVLEGDARWLTSYAVVNAGDTHMVVPMYAPIAPLRDPRYQPESLLPERLRCNDDQWLFIGGRADLVTSILRCGSLSSVDVAEIATALRHHIAAVAARSQRRPISFYARGSDLTLLEAVLMPSHRRTVATYCEIAVPASLEDYVRQLRSRHRNLVRRDWRKLAELGLRSETVEWDAVIEVAAPLIAALSAQHGLPDHRRLVEHRLEMWLAFNELAPIAFAVRADDDELVAVSFGWMFGSRLQMYEVGLTTRATVGRHEAYVEAIIYSPLRFATEHECQVLELGLEAVRPKTLRGAVTQDVEILVGNG